MHEIWCWDYEFRYIKFNIGITISGGLVGRSKHISNEDNIIEVLASLVTLLTWQAHCPGECDVYKIKYNTNQHHTGPAYSKWREILWDFNGHFGWHHQSVNVSGNHRKSTKHERKPNFSDSTVPADGLTSLGVRPSAGAVMTMFRSRLYTRLAPQWLISCQTM